MKKINLIKYIQNKILLHIRRRGINFGSFRRLTPISRQFGSDRGTPICWYYIFSFLEKYSSDIKGNVLEIGDNHYTLKYGGNKVTKSDILHVTGENPKATIIADLSKDNDIPSNTFDCIIFTQTLLCIYDYDTALKTLHRILKPGGVLLATLPGISQISRYDMDRWGDFWRFTTASAKKMFNKYWPEEKIVIMSKGNVLVASAYLYGLASDELKVQELEYVDPDYQMMIVVRAEK